MSRSIRHFPDFEHVDQVLEAAKAWQKKCFRADGSIFSEEALWTRDNIENLQGRIEIAPYDGRTENFYNTLERQLRNASTEEIQLAAEVLWFVYLVPIWKTTESRRARIKQVWELSGRDLPEDNIYLRDSVLKGIVNAGTAYLVNFHLKLKFLLKVAAQWKALSDFDRKSLTGNAHWNFAEWLVNKVGMENQHQFAHAILWFMFPERFERIISAGDLKDIVSTFENRLPQSKKPFSKDLLTSDFYEAIYHIRKSLEKEYGDTPLDFYFPPLLEQWWYEEPDTEAPGERSVQARPSSSSLNTILYGPPGTGKTYATVRRCVEICYGKAPESDEETRKLYDKLVEEEQVEFITFHQSYGYEEFVEGLRPETEKPDSNGQASPGFHLVARDGVLKRMAFRAQQSNSLKPHVLVIDEINRANVSKVLGELVTLLEEDKRAGADNEIAVQLPHSAEHFSLPPNLYILGTMNTADRSIALLDTALRRRFEFVELAPDPEKLQTAKEATGIDLPALLRALNERLEWLIDRDHKIGHAWLMNTRTREDVDQVMRRKIIPFIAEYFYDDWTKVRAALGGTDDFVEGARLKPPPGLGEGMGEEHYQWKVCESFDIGAYDRLISGRSENAKPGEE